MGQAFGKLYDTVFGNSVFKVAILGLNCAGKTTIMNKLHLGEALPIEPTICLVWVDVQYKNVSFTLWDIGSPRPRDIWRHYIHGTHGLIYVVDSLDRERIDESKEFFQDIIKDPLMLNNVILVLANKQEKEGAMTPKEVCEALGLYDLRNHKWHIQSTCALTGEGLNEGMAWFTAAITDLKAIGHNSSIST